MSCSEEFVPQLRARGYRMTPQRHAILHTLCHSSKHLSPAEVYERARREMSGLTETTVYRTLEFLAENGLVHPALGGNGHLAYEIARHEHHHLVCRDCGKQLEVEHSLLRSMYQKLESKSGFRLTDRHITFFGLCADCK
jgi:Fur family ferric uptake transcriptional regulator